VSPQVQLSPSKSGWKIEAIPPAVIETCLPVAEGTACALAATTPAKSNIANKSELNRLISQSTFSPGITLQPDMEFNSPRLNPGPEAVHFASQSRDS
jgi:hypothetical protein